MNILFIIPRLYGGGAERVLTMIASELSKENEVYIVSHEMRRDYDISDNVKVICLNISNSKTNIIRKIIRVVYASVMVNVIKKQKQIEYAVSFGEVTNLENILIRGKGKTIISIRSNYSSRNFNTLKEISIKYANKKADFIVVPSKGIKYDIAHNYDTKIDKIHVINNPCNINMIEEMTKDCVSEEFAKIRNNSDLIFLTVGRLIPEKGQWHIIRAFSTVCKKYKNVHLVIVGDGELREELAGLIEILRVRDNIHLLGTKLNVFPYYKNSDVFVFGSISESFGNVLLEAMACGLPVISSDYNYGAREILSPNTSFGLKTDSYEMAEYGVLVRQMEKDQIFTDDELTMGEKALCDAMMAMINEKKIREWYTKKSRERINDFDIRDVCNKWKDCFNQI